MPYHAKLFMRSPYIPSGLEILDKPPEWAQRFEHDGEWILYKAMSGVPVDPAHAPSRFKVGVAAARLPDLFDIGAGLGVTDLVRDKIEELEPGVHQFLPAEITAKGGERPDRRYWLLHICNRVDAIDPERSALRFAERGGAIPLRQCSRWRDAEDGAPRGGDRRHVPVDRPAMGGGWVLHVGRAVRLCHGRQTQGVLCPPGAFVGGGKRTKLISWEAYIE